MSNKNVSYVIVITVCQDAPDFEFHVDNFGTECMYRRVDCALHWPVDCSP